MAGSTYKYSNVRGSKRRAHSFAPAFVSLRADMSPGETVLRKKGIIILQQSKEALVWV